MEAEFNNCYRMGFWWWLNIFIGNDDRGLIYHGGWVSNAG